MWVWESSMLILHPCMELEPTFRYWFWQLSVCLVVTGSDNVCPMTEFWATVKTTKAFTPRTTDGGPSAVPRGIPAATYAGRRARRPPRERRRQPIRIRSSPSGGGGTEFSLDVFPGRGTRQCDGGRRRPGQRQFNVTYLREYYLRFSENNGRSV